MKKLILLAFTALVFVTIWSCSNVNEEHENHEKSKRILLKQLDKYIGNV